VSSAIEQRKTKGYKDYANIKVKELIDLFNINKTAGFYAALNGFKNMWIQWQNH